ncbi:hypothetical protein J6590_031183 [Homalodisca vitripennis]|nr:hypothetical protein J6590_031183 [Homalodisca vitripennis]
MSCNRCQDKSVPTLVRVTCWGCREGYTVHEKCFHMEEPEKRLYVEKKIWWCPPCLKARTARGYKLEDPPAALWFRRGTTFTVCFVLLSIGKNVNYVLKLIPAVASSHSIVVVHSILTDRR